MLPITKYTAHAADGLLPDLYAPQKHGRCTIDLHMHMHMPPSMPWSNSDHAFNSGGDKLTPPPLRRKQTHLCRHWASLEGTHRHHLHVQRQKGEHRAEACNKSECTQCTSTLWDELLPNLLPKNRGRKRTNCSNAS